MTSHCRTLYWAHPHTGLGTSVLLAQDSQLAGLPPSSLPHRSQLCRSLLLSLAWRWILPHHSFPFLCPVHRSLAGLPQSLSTIYWPTVPRSISQPQPWTQAGTHCSRPSQHLRLSTCTTNSSPTPHPRPDRCLLQPSPQLEGTANLGAVRAMKKSQANPECTCSSTALPPSLKPPASLPDHHTPPCLAPTASPSPLQCRLPPAASRLLSRALLTNRAGVPLPQDLCLCCALWCNAFLAPL